MDDTDKIRDLEDKFLSDSGSDLDEVDSDESDELVFTDLLPVVKHFDNISNEHLNISVLENNLNVNVNENEHNSENAAE